MRRKGFTLIELLVVISLVLILTIAALQNSSRAGRDFAFNSEYNRVLQTIRGVRALSVSNDTVTDSVFDYDQDGLTNDPVFPYGYGLLIKKGTPSTMTIFTDMPQGDSGKMVLGVNDLTKEVIEIDERFDLDLDAGGTVSELLIYYEPPYGFANFSSYSSAVNFFYITVEDKDTGNKKKIMIHRAAGVPELEFKNT